MDIINNSWSYVHQLGYPGGPTLYGYSLFVSQAGKVHSSAVFSGMPLMQNLTLPSRTPPVSLSPCKVMPPPSYKWLIMPLTSIN